MHAGKGNPIVSAGQKWQREGTTCVLSAQPSVRQRLQSGGLHPQNFAGAKGSGHSGSGQRPSSARLSQK